MGMSNGTQEVRSFEEMAAQQEAEETATAEGIESVGEVAKQDEEA